VSKRALLYLETVGFALAVGVPVHVLAGLDWPWALVVGIGAAMVLRVLIHGQTAARL
jgi:hypothetical protein